jgi:chromosomal replication initiator protein
MAWAAAEAVSKNLGKSYNPLFLWGGVGVGKTHLMLAIGHAALTKNPDLNVLYCMGEEFTTEIVEAIRNKSTQHFKRRYRNLDLIMVDDVQFIAGKNAVQEEFFHTFNTLLREGGQIVLTSDRPPSEIQKLEERLRSRFEAGLIIDISPPDMELRAAIALIKGEDRGLQLSMEVASLIASHIEGLRKLEGFLTRIWTEVQGDSTKVTVDLVNKLLGKIENRDDTMQNRRAIIPQDVVDAVAEYFSLGRRKLLGEGRARPIAVPRQVLMYILRVELGLPLQEVGHIVGGRDHTTVMHAVEKISKNISTDAALRQDIMGIKKTISGQM